MARAAAPAPAPAASDAAPQPIAAADFPVHWERAGDAELFWTLDQVHWGEPMAPLVFSVAGHALALGLTLASAAYDRPIARGAVLWGDTDAALKPNPDEVSAVFRIGLKALVDGEPRFVAIPESDRPVVQMPLGNDLIHAPTGAVLYQLRRGRAPRTDR